MHFIHDYTVYFNTQDKARQAIRRILDILREFVALGCAFFAFAQCTVILHDFARRILHFSPKQHVKIGRYAKIEIPT